METMQENERLERIIDGLTIAELLSDMESAVGSRKRVRALMAWAVWWGLAGETSGSELRSRFEAEGMTERSAYRAALDFKRIGEYLQERHADRFSVEHPPDAPTLLRKIAYAMSL